MHTFSLVIEIYELKGTIIMTAKINYNHCKLSSQLKWLNFN